MSEAEVDDGASALTTSFTGSSGTSPGSFDDPFTLSLAGYTASGTLAAGATTLQFAPDSYAFSFPDPLAVPEPHRSPSSG